MTEPIVAWGASGRRRRVGGISPGRLCILRSMDPITSRNRNRSVSADAYWRRRLFALAAGLAVLGLLAWAVGGASAPRQTAATTSLHHQGQRGSPPATGGSPAGPASPSPSPSPSPSRGPAHGGKHAGQGAGPRPRHTAGA